MGKRSSHQQIYPIMAVRLMIIPDLRKGETTKSPRNLRVLLQFRSSRWDMVSEKVAGDPSFKGSNPLW